MRKPPIWHFVDVERLLCREEVSRRSNGGRPRAGWPSAADVRWCQARDIRGHPRVQRPALLTMGRATLVDTAVGPHTRSCRSLDWTQCFSRCHCSAGLRSKPPWQQRRNGVEGTGRQLGQQDALSKLGRCRTSRWRGRRVTPESGCRRRAVAVSIQIAEMGATTSLRVVDAGQQRASELAVHGPVQLAPTKQPHDSVVHGRTPPGGHSGDQGIDLSGHAAVISAGPGQPGRRSFLRILPVAPFGRLSRNSMLRGYL